MARLKMFIIIIGLNMILFKGKYLRYKGRAVINKYKTYDTMIAKNNNSNNKTTLQNVFGNSALINSENRS